MNKIRISVISDTHTKHDELSYNLKDLPGGDLLIHAGDIMNSGYNPKDITNFCKWFNGLNQYQHKVFIAGNHDRIFENDPAGATEIYTSYKNIDYLQDDFIKVGDDDGMIKIWGSPWQPEFYNWAFNLPKCGIELEAKWNAIPEDVDILITHGPPQQILDTSGAPYNEPNLGCPLLRVRVDAIKPKIHVFGHIHGSHGYKFLNGTHFFNASILNERYEYQNKPITFDWCPVDNTVSFI
jgi:Icc-related predicted phosphoesterase